MESNSVMVDRRRRTREGAREEEISGRPEALVPRRVSAGRREAREVGAEPPAQAPRGCERGAS